MLDLQLQEPSRPVPRDGRGLLSLQGVAFRQLGMEKVCSLFSFRMHELRSLDCATSINSSGSRFETTPDLSSTGRQCSSSHGKPVREISAP